MAAPFISSGRTHSEPSRVPRHSRIGTDFRKSSCNYTKFQVASINNKKVIRGGAGPTQSGIDIGVTRKCGVCLQKECRVCVMEPTLVW